MVGISEKKRALRKRSKRRGIGKRSKRRLSDLTEGSLCFVEGANTTRAPCSGREEARNHLATCKTVDLISTY